MPEVVKLASCKICIYAGDHAPPHFHILGRGWSAVVDIASLELTKGGGPKGSLREAVRWAELPENLALLAAEWRRLNDRE
jgi:hypothetical protein